MFACRFYEGQQNIYFYKVFSFLSTWEQNKKKKNGPLSGLSSRFLITCHEEIKEKKKESEQRQFGVSSDVAAVYRHFNERCNRASLNQQPNETHSVILRLQAGESQTPAWTF